MPTEAVLGDDKDSLLYDILTFTLSRLKKFNIIIVIGDFNAEVGVNN